MPDSPTPVPLSSSTLGSLSPALAIPRYDRHALTAGIVHLGVGGFHRAHLATYADELCAQGETTWAITGAGVLPSDAHMARVLHDQDHLYTLITRGPSEVDARIIGSIIDYVHAVPDPQQLVDAIAAPTTSVVSLTVTEGGYPVDDLTGAFIATSANADDRSAFGLLVAGLDRRRRIGASGITVLSCDNVIGNGRVARTAALGVAERYDPRLAQWIEHEVTFPNSMVDRITPATTDHDRSWLATECGVLDRWPVATEPFRQWVVEDAFASSRMPLERLDVLTTSDVEPYEVMKLRLLNAGHSCLAYLAALDGLETVDRALGAAHLRSFLEVFLTEEAQPVLPPITGISVDDYIDSLLERFSNPSIGDQISRLCLDGSSKFPKFLLPTVRAQLVAGGPIRLSALALAAWCVYLSGPRDGLAPDAHLDEAQRFANASLDDPRQFLAFTTVFGDDLAGADRFAGAFVDAVRHLREQGVRSAIAAVLAEGSHLDGRPPR
ncbi:MAG: mannitol dehydrogenase family protein [Actinomycetota bacterium]